METKSDKLPIHYRQGDVLIQRIDKIPASAKKVKGSGPVIMAYGTATGHHHQFLASDATEYRDGDQRYARVHGPKISGEFSIVRKWKNQVDVKVPDIGMVAFSVDDVVVNSETAIVNGSFGLMRHEEHWFHAIVNGDIKLNQPQREYSPEALRNVQD